MRDAAEPDKAEIRAAVLELVLRRGAGKTACPSEVARALARDWRPLMPAVRLVAAELERDGKIVVTQKGAPVSADRATGPIRLGLPPSKGV